MKIEEMMRQDQNTIIEMNRRILEDFQKVEQDRTTQIKKLIFSYANALAENSHRVKQVFDAENNKNWVNNNISSDCIWL